MEILYSETSSKGNCSVIESADGHLLIIDAGIKYSKVDRAIGYKLHTADALLITHAHNDHTAYITDFLFNGIDTFAVLSTAPKTIKGPCTGMFHLVEKNKNIYCGGFTVKPVEMVHTNADGTPCECYGFLILDKSTGEKMLWVTDTQLIKNAFPPLEYYCIESNFFEREYEADDVDYFEKSVEQRRWQGHMSFESVLKFLDMQDLSKCKEIRLLHISSKLPQSAKEEMKRRIKERYNLNGVEVYA